MTRKSILDTRRHVNMIDHFKIQHFKYIDKYATFLFTHAQFIRPFNRDYLFSLISQNNNMCFKLSVHTGPGQPWSFFFSILISVLGFCTIRQTLMISPPKVYYTIDFYLLIILLFIVWWKFCISIFEYRLVLL